MRIAFDIHLADEIGQYTDMLTKAWDALGEYVDLSELPDLHVIAVEPMISPAKTQTDLVKSPPTSCTGDVTITLEGSTYCVQEVCRRWENYEK